MLVQIISTAALLTSLAADFSGSNPGVEIDELPRVPATPPEAALETFQIKEGFMLELVAAEPLVVDPIAVCFDENSRMFIVEMRDYSERRDERLGRIRMLEDSDGDGRMDRSTVFAEGLPWPTALFWSNGGLFVASTPDVYYFRDTNGDGRADEKQVVFTGFGAQASRLNVQALPNNFHWTLDNRIHGATSFNGGVVECPAHPEHGKTILRGHDFSFDPRTFELRAESGGGQHGLTFDNYGRKFLCSNSSHIRQVMYEARYLDGDVLHPLPPASLEIPVDGGAAEVFRLSPDEPWRVIRTKWRVAGLVSGPVEGGGRSSGYFTSASGLVIYRGDALGEEFVGDEFVADVGSNLVHRKKLRPNGVAFLAERPADEQNVEFLASTDNWFRPVQLANGPDGALYLLDMYRETIEHPWSLPPNLKKHLDLNSGNDRGRIYRIVPDDFERRPWPKLGDLDSAALVKLLEHPNSWHRETASRLLWERQPTDQVPALRQLARQSESPLGRLHALAALRGLDALQPNDLIMALRDSDAGVRENAVRWSESFLGNSASHNALWEALQGRAGDEAVRVRYQLAWTLGQVAREEKWPMLAALLESGDDAWLHHAVLASAGAAPLRVWQSLAASHQFAPSGLALLELAGRKGNAGELATLSSSLNEASEGQLVTALSAVLRGAKAAGSRLQPTSLPLFARALHAAQGILSDTQSSAGAKKEAISLLSTGGKANAQTIAEVIGSNSPVEVQSAAMDALADLNAKQAVEVLTAQWSSLPEGLRRSAIDSFLRKTATATALLKAISEGHLDKNEVPVPQIDPLRNHRDRRISQLARKIFGEKSEATREEVLAQFHPALSLKGNADRGQAIYAERCASCHQFRGEGFQAGPDLETIQQAGRESALANIIDPNREVAPQYISFEIATRDGESHSGIIAQETTSSVTLRQANGHTAEIPRRTMTSMRSSGKSLMPEGLEQGLTPAEMADLLAYILP